MSFEDSLDIWLGEREIMEEVECTICGHDETYYMNPLTNKTIGRACKTCDFIQKIE